MAPLHVFVIQLHNHSPGFPFAFGVLILFDDPLEGSEDVIDIVAGDAGEDEGGGSTLKLATCCFPKLDHTQTPPL